MEALRKLFKDQIHAFSRRNFLQTRSFADMLENTIRHYQNRSLNTAQGITELIELAKQICVTHHRGEDLGLAEELAFYDALETKLSVIQVVSEETLRTIARELVDTVRNGVTIDWTVRKALVLSCA